MPECAAKARRCRFYCSTNRQTAQRAALDKNMPVSYTHLSVVPLRGGMAGTYLATTGEAGRAVLHCRMEGRKLSFPAADGLFVQHTVRQTGRAGADQLYGEGVQGEMCIRDSNKTGSAGLLRRILA